MTEVILEEKLVSAGSFGQVKSTFRPTKKTKNDRKGNRALNVLGKQSGGTAASGKEKDKVDVPGPGIDAGGSKGVGQKGGKEIDRTDNANAMKPKKKKGTGKQGVGPKKAAGAKGKKIDGSKAGEEKQQDGESEAGQEKKKGETLKKAAIYLRNLDKFMPIPGRLKGGDFTSLDKATGTDDYEEKLMDRFDNSSWLLFYRASKGNFVYTYYAGKGDKAEIVNDTFKKISPAAGKISQAPTSTFQYITALKQLLRIKFEQSPEQIIVKKMNKILEQISDNIVNYYNLIKDDPKTQFDKDLVSSAEKVKQRSQEDTSYAMHVPASLKSAFGVPTKTAIATQPTRQRESKTMNQDDIKKLIKEAFTDKVYGKYPYSHKSGDQEEPAEDYMETWKKLCLNVVRDESRTTAIAVAKLLIKDLELFEDVLDLAGQNQSVGTEILKIMEKNEKDMI